MDADVRAVLLATSRLVVLALAVVQLGATATGSVSVGATVTANCTIAGSTLAFGNYDPFSATALNANSPALTVTCTRGAGGVTVSLGPGLNPGHAVGTSRAMGSGTDYLSYELYTSSAYTTVWNTTNTVALSTPTSMASTTMTVYGRVPALQNAAVGSYSDSVTATVNF